MSDWNLTHLFNPAWNNQAHLLLLITTKDPVESSDDLLLWMWVDPLLRPRHQVEFSLTPMFLIINQILPNVDFHVTADTFACHFIFCLIFRIIMAQTEPKVTQNKPPYLNRISNIQSCVLCVCDIWNSPDKDRWPYQRSICLPDDSPFFPLRFDPDLTPWPCLVNLPFGFVRVHLGGSCADVTPGTTRRVTGARDVLSSCGLNGSQALLRACDWSSCDKLGILCLPSVESVARLRSGSIINTRMYVYPQDLRAD